MVGVGLTCIHGTGGDVVNADTTGLEFLGDAAGSVSHPSLLLQECMQDTGVREGSTE